MSTGHAALLPAGEHPPEQLAKFGIHTWPQALLCLPRDFEDYQDVATLREAIGNGDLNAGDHTFNLIVTNQPVIVPQPKKRLVFEATDGMLSVKITVFLVAGVDVASWKSLEVGQRIQVKGTLQNWAGRLQMTSPQMVPANRIGTIYPRYPSKRGVVKEETLRAAVVYALDKHLDDAVQYILQYFAGADEDHIRRSAKLTVTSIRNLLIHLHRPATIRHAQRAVEEARRLAAYSVVFSATRLKNREADPDSAIPLATQDIASIIDKLPMSLTSDQKRAIHEIVEDLTVERPMRRILTGDVGTGKTLVYMIPAIAANRQGRRVAVMTPNVLLAQQFVAELKGLFGDTVNVKAITGNSKRQLLLEHENPILVGTTALLSRLPPEQKPNFLIVDEQQRFGVAQKEAILSPSTNYLEATATPIPRTTALVTHGAMDVSVLRQSPVKKDIQTFLVMAAEAKRLFDHASRIVHAGGQIAVVYPLVDNDAESKKSVVQSYQLWDSHFPGRVALLHGELTDAEKLSTVQRLKSGEYSVICCSTIVEIGLTIPSLRAIVVVHPERYGASTLHQLRGRLARHGGKGYFFLYLPTQVAPETMARLQLVVDINDGFALAESDAQMRGYGDLFENAEKQHGKSSSTLFLGASLSPEDIHQFVS